MKKEVKTKSVAIAQYEIKLAGIVNFLKITEANLVEKQNEFKNIIKLSKIDLKNKKITANQAGIVEATNLIASTEVELNVYEKHGIELAYLAQLITDTLTKEENFEKVKTFIEVKISENNSRISILKTDIEFLNKKIAIFSKLEKEFLDAEAEKASKEMSKDLENATIEATKKSESDSLFQFGYQFREQKSLDNFKVYLNRYKHYIFMDLQGKQVVSEKYTDSVTGLVNWTHRSFKDFREHTLSDIFYVINKNTGYEQKVYFSEEWLETDWMRTQYRKTTFNPDPSFKHAPDLYNFWEGFVEAKKGDVSKFINHIDLLIDGTKEEKAYLIKLLAYVIRNPHKVTGTTLALFGEQGCGKSSVSYFLTKLCPNHAQFFDDLESVMAGFNGETLAVKFFLWEEALWGGSKKMEGKFKHFVTGATRTVEIKGVTKLIIPNYAFHVFTSNNEWLVPVDKGDRRNNIFGCTKTLIGNTKYFDELYAWIDGEGKHALYDFLLNEVDLTNFNPRATIETDVKIDVKLKSLDDFSSFMMAVLSGDITEQALDLWNDVERTVERDSLYEAFTSYHTHSRMDKREFSSKLAALLNFSSVAEKWKDNWKSKKDGKSYSYYKLPVIEVARKMFAESIKETTDTLFNRVLKTTSKTSLTIEDLVKPDTQLEAQKNYIDKLENIEIKNDSKFSEAKNKVPAKKLKHNLS